MRSVGGAGREVVNGSDGSDDCSSKFCCTRNTCTVFSFSFSLVFSVVSSDAAVPPTHTAI